MRFNGAMEAGKVSRVLIADDDRALCGLLADYLRHDGFDVDVVNDGDAVLQRVGSRIERPDLVILDVMMPGRDGLATLKELRLRHRLPVIMLSARGEPVDRVIGLELGADDYLAKPFLPRELLARVHARLRRAAPPAAHPLTVGNLQLFPAEFRARVDAADLALTGAEFQLLLELARRAGEVVDKATLTAVALGRRLERFDRSVDVHVSRVRHKLGAASVHAPRIESVRGVGYVLTAGAP